jgi:5-methylcytosine-specific restriction endonuclease McrA
MPTNPPGYQNKYYKANKSKWNNPTETAKRVDRNAARADFAKKMGVSPTDLKGDVDHKKPLRNGGSSKLSNLQLIPASKNRGWKARGKA